MKKKIQWRQLSGILYEVIIDTLRRHSLALLILSFLFIYLGKIEWHIEKLGHLPKGRSSLNFIAYIADDLLFFGSIILLLWSAEYLIRKKWFSAITIGFAIPISIVSVSNLFWLRGTGSQLTVSTIKVGLTRTAEVIPALREGLGSTGIALLVTGVTIIAGLPFLFKAKWNKDGKDASHRLPATIAIPLLFLFLGVVGQIYQRIAHTQATAGWKLIADNVFVAVANEIINEPNLSPAKTQLANPAPTKLNKDYQSQPQPNILIYLMEATAYRASSFAHGMEQQTPFLKKLASEGLSAHSMRSVLPHTTKSIFSMLCGQYPSMQHEILETADNYGMHCLPQILSEYGYATAFFQTADGRFEDRPRLIRNMGFNHFEALQNLRTKPQSLGYLAGDDDGVVAPVFDWVKEQEKPFFIVILTSATHHTYEIPKRMLKQKSLEDAQSWSFPKKYLVLVHELDRILEDLVSGFQTRGKADDFLLLASGDHGEAFGEHGGYQHDNIFWEEGLHVPFVVWSPNRIKPGQMNMAPRSLLDVAPTLLDAAGIRFRNEAFAGRSLLRATSPVRRYFSCWYSNVCVGFVEGNKKLVYLPSAKSWVVYDLQNDPLEKFPIVDSPEWEKKAMEAYRWYNENRFTQKHLHWHADKIFNNSWTCSEGAQECHSN